MNRLRLAGLALALTAVVSVIAVSGVFAAPSSAPHKTAVVKIKVTAGEFFFKLSKSAVKAPATVVFTVTNGGQVPHDFDITSLGKKTPLLDAGKSATMRIVFKHKGRYQYICSVPRHAEQGMSGTFIVK